MTLTEQINPIVRGRLSDDFILAVKRFPGPIWKKASDADLCPSILYKGMSGAELYRLNDTRFNKLAEIVGFKGNIFQEVK